MILRLSGSSGGLTDRHWARVDELFVSAWGFVDRPYLRVAADSPRSRLVIADRLDPRDVPIGVGVAYASEDLAVGESAALAAVGVDLTPGDLYIDALVVKEGHRGRGIGRELVAAGVAGVTGKVVASVARVGVGTPVVSLLAALGFRAVTGPVVDFWTAQSRADPGWVCRVCGGICRCPATVFLLGPEGARPATG